MPSYTVTAGSKSLTEYKHDGYVLLKVSRLSIMKTNIYYYPNISRIQLFLGYFSAGLSGQYLDNHISSHAFKKLNKMQSQSWHSCLSQLLKE